MGFMTTITILNDGFDQIEKYPKEFVECIKDGKDGVIKPGGISNKLVNDYGVGNFCNCVKVAQSHHADNPRLYLVYQNMMVSLGLNNDITNIELRKRLLEIAKTLIKNEEEQIKRIAIEKGNK